METSMLAKVDPILEHALELAGEQRGTYLNEACGEDRDLREAIDELMALHTRADAYLETTRHLSAELAAAFGEPDDLVAGKRIGAYRLVEEIGRGGMGRVFLAERDDGQFDRRVAVKLLAAGLHSDSGKKQFKQELEILARLQHPNIAVMHDSGIDESGFPYFIMEYLDAQNVDDYADQREMSIRGRIELFLQICEAVRFAHAHLVIHRDIKPSNVLVTDEGKAKLLDFGIARRLADHSMSGDARDQMMTPEFAAPEQLAGETVTVATDLYLLGNLLYRLLTGAAPLSATSIHDRIRKLCWQEPKLASEVEITRAVASRRGCSPKTLKKRLAGDLDFILAKALERNPEDRYASVSALAADLRRHLGNRPIEARPHTPAYVMSSFVRRNRTLVAVMSLVMMLILGFALSMTWMWQVTLKERNLARTERDTAEEVTLLLTDLFESSDPETTRGTEITVRDMLGRGRDRIDEALADQPEVRARMQDVLGKVFRNLGFYDTASELHQQVLDYQRQQTSEGANLGKALAELAHNAILGADLKQAELLTAELEQLVRENKVTDPLLIADFLDIRGAYLCETAAYEEALALHQEALDLRRKLLGPKDRQMGDSYFRLGETLFFMAKYPEAEDYLNRALTTYRASLGKKSPRISKVMARLGVTFRVQSKLTEAEAVYREVLQLERDLYDEDHPLVAAAQVNLATILKASGNYKDAKALYEESLQMLLARVGETHGDTAICLNNLAEVNYLLGNVDVSLELFRRALHISETVKGATNPLALTIRSNISVIYQNKGEFLKAREQAQTVLDLREQLLGKDHPDQVTTLNSLAGTYLAVGEYQQAVPILERAIAICRSHYAEDFPTLLVLRHGLAKAYEEMDQLARAEEILRDVLRLAQGSSKGAQLVVVYRTSLAGVLIQARKFPEAEQEILPALADARETYPPGHYRINKLEVFLGSLRTGQGRYGEAESLLLSAHAALDSDKAHPGLKDLVQERLFELYQAWGKPKKAQTFQASRP